MFNPLDTLLGVVDACYGLYSHHSKKHLSRYCSLETVDLLEAVDGTLSYGNEIVSDTGDYLTVIRLDGAMSIMGEADIDELAVTMARELQQYLERPGYAIQSYFVRDPGRARDVAMATVEQARQNSMSKDLQVDFILNERAELLPQFLVDEQCYFALWTQARVLSNAELAASKADETAKGKKGPKIANGQFVLRGRDALRDKHRSFVDSFMSFAHSHGLLAETLSVQDQLKAIRSSIYTDRDRTSWTARLPLDDVTIRERETAAPRDISSIVPEPLFDQLFAQDGETLDVRYCKLGDRYYSSLDMTLAPSNLLPLSDLVRRINQGSKGTPWRMSVLTESGIKASIGMKSLWAIMPSLIDDQSGRVKKSLDAIGRRIADGELFVKIRVNFATWADDLPTLKRRALALASAVEAWGNPSVNERTGDPIEAVLSSSLGLDVSSTAEPAYPDVLSAFKMLPLGRMASPFKRGTTAFRTPDGKLWPFSTGSSLQTHWLDIIAAPPGSGKSVMMNMLNLTTCMAAPRPGANPELPYLITLDIGPSSQGLITLLQETLPAKQRHLVQYVQLQNTRDFCVNVFDTQLGCRYPTPSEQSFLENFLTLILAPGGLDESASLEGLITLIIKALYDHFSDERSPRNYAANTVPLVDKALAETNLLIDDKTSWWEVVDHLFDAGKVREAIIAQRQAVPTLQDIPGILHTPAIKDTNGTRNLPSGELVLDAINRLVAQLSEQLPIVTGVTRFETSARILALNLEHVAPDGEGFAARQTAAMYMLGRHIARDFFLGDPTEQIRHYPARYRDYHFERLAALFVSTKRFVMDEAHRPLGNAIATPRRQLNRDVRESRKLGVEFLIASQQVTDFPPDVIANASSFWIMGRPNDEKMIAEVCERASLNEASEYVLRNYLNGPTKKGAPFLLKMNTKFGAFQQHLYASLGPVELWSFSTTRDDVALRGRLFKQIGIDRALIALAQRFPSGTAVAELEELTERMDQERVAEPATRAMEQIVDEILAIDHRRQQAAA